MKKKAVLILSMSLTAGCLLSGCGGEKPEETEIALETFAEDQPGSTTITSDAGTVQFKGETDKDEIYDFGYKAADYISLGDYRTIKVEKTQPKESSDEEVKSRISDLLSKKNIWNDKTEGTVNQYDLVNMDINCTIDGTPYSPASKKDTNIKVGNGNFLKEFEEKIIGKQIGDTVTFTITMPESQQFSDADGKDAVFTVYIKSVRTQPEFTDEIAGKLSGQKFQTAAQYQEHIKQLITEEKQEQHNSEVFLEVMGQISGSIDIKEIPGVETENDLTYETIQKEAEDKGISPIELVQEYEAAEKTVSADSTQEHSMDLLAMYIADQNGIMVTGEDIADYKNNLIEKGTYSEDEIDKALSEREIAHMALNKKVMAYIAELAES